jgi:hypothetical protein
VRLLKAFVKSARRQSWNSGKNNDEKNYEKRAADNEIIVVSVRRESSYKSAYSRYPSRRRQTGKMERDKLLGDM